MTTTGANTREVFRFGDFELDVAAYELRRLGQPVRLERQPMDLLILLVRHRGELVSRSEIVDLLWGKDVFVDVETGVHTAARKIRQALGDSSDAPAFLETVPGKGYRFIAAVEAGAAPADSARRPKALAAWVGLALASVVAGGGAWVWLRSAPVPAHVTLAVLPFANLSGDQQQEYLADGLTEDTISSLGQIDPDRLSVVGRTSTMAYKGTRKSLADIGRELGVDYLVESSLRLEGERLRVTATLIRVGDQVRVWSETYDRAASSVLGLQSELSTAVAEQIRLRLSPQRLEALSRRHTRNAAAYDAYLRALDFSAQRTPAANQHAVEYYRRAIALDAGYALAWSSLAHVYAASAINGDAAPSDVAALARDASEQAVRARPDLPEGMHARAYVHWLLEWNWSAAEAEQRRALVLDPGYAFAHLTLGHTLSQMGRHGEAMAAMRRARELDPLSPLAAALSAQVAFQAREYDAAVEHARQAIAINPQLWIGYMQRGQAEEQRGNGVRALEDLARAATFSGGNSKASSLKGYILAKLGRTNEAREILRALERDARERYVPPYAMALVQAGLGDRDAVFASLDRAFAARDVHLIYLPVDPKWDAYRGDPRFAALVERCGFTGARPRTAQ